MSILNVGPAGMHPAGRSPWWPAKKTGASIVCGATRVPGRDGMIAVPKQRDLLVVRPLLRDMLWEVGVRRVSLIVFVAMLAGWRDVAPGEWPHWRGPARDGVAQSGPRTAW